MRALSPVDFARASPLLPSYVFLTPWTPREFSGPQGVEDWRVSSSGMPMWAGKVGDGVASKLSEAGAAASRKGMGCEVYATMVREA